MKKLLLLFLFAGFTFSCTNNDVVVTFDDDKSSAIKAHFENYLKNDMDGLKELWSPDIKVYLNSKQPINLDEFVGILEAQHAGFDPIHMTFGEEGGEDLGVWVQTITYPAIGEYPSNTITQSWFDWNATGKATGKKIVLPAHIGFKWGKDGKIIEEYHTYDTQEMMAELALMNENSDIEEDRMNINSKDLEEMIIINSPKVKNMK